MPTTTTKSTTLGGILLLVSAGFLIVRLFVNYASWAIAAIPLGASLILIVIRGYRQSKDTDSS